jgi:putative transposase
MKYERKLAHTIYDHKHHLCWITKYRFPMLTGEIAGRAREIIKQICKENEVEILQGHIRPEHVHLVVSIPPHLAISKLVQYLKGKSARKLLQEFEILRKRYYGGNLWARGYYSATSGNVTDEMVIDYVRNQDKEDEDDNFLVSDYS